MLIRNYLDVPAKDVEEDAEGVKIRQVISKNDGAPHFVMRVFELRLNGHTPRHAHEWEHEVFILSGEGSVFDSSGQEHKVCKGDVVFIPGDEMHQFRNTGRQLFEFICLIPI
ncbi:cupin domain-containing protein [bacterium]|nr:cupin domain-containing protein [bacterium]